MVFIRSFRSARRVAGRDRPVARATLTEFQLVDPFLQFVETQKDPAILAKQLPAEPAADSDDKPTQDDSENENVVHEPRGNNSRQRISGQSLAGAFSGSTRGPAKFGLGCTFLASLPKVAVATAAFTAMPAPAPARFA